MRNLLVVAALLGATLSPGVVAAAPTPAPSPTVSPTARPAGSAVPSPAPAGNTGRPASQTPTRAAATPTRQAASKIGGSVFRDANGDGLADDDEDGLPDLEVDLVGPKGLALKKNTDGDGTFGFEDLPAGGYTLSVVVPDGFTTTRAAERSVQLDGIHDLQVAFGLIELPPPVPTAEPTQEVAAAEAPPSEDDAAPGAEAADASRAEAGEDPEQVAAMIAITALPLKFAEGRDLLAHVARRALGDGVLWLGIPFETQLDGSEFQFVNCGPASLAMVLAGFGLQVEPSQVRDYLNGVTDNFDRDSGTSLDVLSNIGRQAGLTPIDLYSERGGYRDWSVEAVRWHVEHGHPVITLVKYKRLPGHFQSSAETDHYIVVSGLTATGFIYNDAAFQSTLGYGLEISDEGLEQAWNNSSIPHHAAAFALADGSAGLSFPELPRPTATSDPWYPPATADYANRPVEPPPAIAAAPSDLSPSVPAPAPTPVLTATGALSGDGLDDPSVEALSPVTRTTGPAGLMLDEEQGIADTGGAASIVPRAAALGAMLLLAWSALRLAGAAVGFASARGGSWRLVLGALLALFR